MSCKLLSEGSELSNAVMATGRCRLQSRRALAAPWEGLLPPGDALPSRRETLRVAHPPEKHHRQRRVSAQHRAEYHRHLECAKLRDPAGARTQSRGGSHGHEEHPIIEPGTEWAGYLNRLDLRLSKGFNLKRYRFRVDANLYNVFNSAFVNSVNTTFSTTASNQFMRPTSVLQGRLFKVGGQFEF
jgi:hypothetical protein